MFKLNAQGVQEQVPTVNTFIRSHTGMQDAGNQAAHIAQDAGDAIAKGAQDAGAGIADGVQQFGKGIADGLKQLPEIKLTKFGWGKK